MIAALLTVTVHPTIPDLVTFAISGALVLSGAAGVVWSRNAVHAALSLVMTLFGIAVLFIEEDANFLAAVQVIVYAGAVVVLFLFVIMFLGVDREERVEDEPLRGQRPLAVVLVTIAVGGVVALLADAHWAVTGAHTVTGRLNGPHGEVGQLGTQLFTRYLFAFEATAGLLVIAVVGAVVLARRPSLPPDSGDEYEKGPAVGGEPGDADVDADADAASAADSGDQRGYGHDGDQHDGDQHDDHDQHGDQHDPEHDPDHDQHDDGVEAGGRRAGVQRSVARGIVEQAGTPGPAEREAVPAVASVPAGRGEGVAR